MQCTEFQGVGLLSEAEVPTDCVLRQVRLLFKQQRSKQFEMDFKDIFGEQDTYFDGEFLKPHFRKAGFEDISVQRTIIDIGDWRHPGNHLFYPYIIEGAKTKAAAAGRVAVDIWYGAFEANCERLYPDDEERVEFLRKLKADLGNPDYKLYTIA